MEIEFLVHYHCFHSLCRGPRPLRTHAEVRGRGRGPTSSLAAIVHIVVFTLCRSVAEAEVQRKADLIAAIVRRREAKRAALMPEPAPTPPSTPSGGGEGATAAAASALVRGGSYRGAALTLDALPTWGGHRGSAPCCRCRPSIGWRQRSALPFGFPLLEAIHTCSYLCVPHYPFL